jgi:electron transport complex protein RnfC
VRLAEENEYSILRVKAQTYPTAADPLVAAAISGKEPDVAFRGVHESGELVLDVDTVLRVARACAERRPVLDRLITVGSPSGRKVIRVPVGMTLADAVKAAGEADEFRKVLVGGPLQGSALHTLDFPIAKDTTAIWLFSEDEIMDEVNHPCISCGLCVTVCPMRLLPGLLSRYCEFGKWGQAEEAHLFSCIECGCCAYVCPAGRSMVQFMVHGKNELLALWRSA